MAQPHKRDSQFGLPRGVLGSVVGWVMAIGNADMEHRAIDALSLRDDEAVLEIGFGPGVGIRLLTRRLSDGFAAGVDPSEVMLTQAGRRNRHAVRTGKVELRQATVSSLPWPDGRFDAAVSVNNIQEWPSLSGALAELRRVVKSGGRVSIAVHAWVDKFAKDRGDPDKPWEQHLSATLEEAGFTNVQRRRGRAVSGRAIYLTGDAP